MEKFKKNLYLKMDISNEYEMFFMSSEYDIYECILGSIIKSYIDDILGTKSSLRKKLPSKISHTKELFCEILQK